MNISERLKGISPKPKDLRGCRGLYFNKDQHRVEMIADSLPAHDPLMCWVSVEQLFEMGKMNESTLNYIIQDAPNPLQEFYLDFFYPARGFAPYFKFMESKK